jgi:ferrochelatase
MTRTGVLLINLGTPDAPTPEAVGRYLREFLMDEYVINLPKPFRWFLVNVMIVPRRKSQSANAYKKVQLAEGSPLLFHTRRLAEKVAEQLDGADDGFVIEYAMRYGNPAIASGLRKLAAKEVSRIIVLPLYPQYAESSVETAVAETRRRAIDLGIGDRLTILPPFYDRPEFVQAFAHQLAEDRRAHSTDHTLFSFHSLPVRQVTRLDQTQAHCLVRRDCCEAVTGVNGNCYRAQCFATAYAIAGKLNLKPEDYTVSFQSRLGRAEWIGPNTEDLLKELARRGKKKIAVACPSFVADCLETLEEIAIRGRETFIDAGGEELRLIPSLNSEAHWVRTVADWIRQIEGHGPTPELS